MFSLLILFSASAFCVILGDALRLCRELQYSYVVSQAAVEEFDVPSGAAVAIDQRLVTRYYDMSETMQSSQQCLFHWKNLMCSHVFRTSNDAPACHTLCVKAGEACAAATPNFCAESNAAKCTNYGELTGFCANGISVDTSPSPPSSSPTSPRTSDCPTVTVTLSIFLLLITLVLVHLALH